MPTDARSIQNRTELPKNIQYPYLSTRWQKCETVGTRKVVQEVFNAVFQDADKVEIIPVHCVKLIILRRCFILKVDLVVVPPVHFLYIFPHLWLRLFVSAVCDNLLHLYCSSRIFILSFIRTDMLKLPEAESETCLFA